MQLNFNVVKLGSFLVSFVRRRASEEEEEEGRHKFVLLYGPRALGRSRLNKWKLGMDKRKINDTMIDISRVKYDILPAEQNNARNNIRSKYITQRRANAGAFSADINSVLTSALRNRSGTAAPRHGDPIKVK